MRKVMAFGTFDCVHAGHMFYFKKARALGDHLTVVVAMDSGARKIKGRSPVNGERDRLALVKHIDLVDSAILGDREMRKWGVIKRIHPVAIALGYDQWASVPSLRKELNALGLNPRIVRIKSFKPHKNSSSRLRSKN